jgi:hypothetical protein
MLEMILLDWTRMGSGTYCLAGAVLERGYRIVRPLPVKNRSSAQRKFGWWFRAFEGRSRWEVFELVRPQTADPEPPHVEDMWVVNLRPSGRLATAEQRRAILEATLVKPGEPLFGQPLQATRASAYLQPDVGQRSLATIKVPAASIVFTGSYRDGTIEPDIRVQLPVPDLGTRTLPVKDHHLLLRAKAAGPDPNLQVAALNAAIAGMGDTVAVRVGLSRAFSSSDGSGAAASCWLMADGFFSWSDPQP